jgi:hypothetical protein
LHLDFGFAKLRAPEEQSVALVSRGAPPSAQDHRKIMMGWSPFA